MAFWEFLIQKEGDRSWLPLESPTVEILEGRYRVVARSDRVRTPVEIRVIQNAAAETPPVRRTQKRLSQTNQDGLMVVIPFTRLVPGEWELRCGSDVMSDMMGEGWLYRVQLQVLPIDLETDDDWEPDWDKELAIAPSETFPSEASPTAEASQISQDQELAQNKDFLQSQPESQPEYLPISQADAEQLPGMRVDRPSSLQITLEQQTYVVKRGLPLVLRGQVLRAPTSGEESPLLEETAVSGGKLRVRLFDPQTSRMLVDETQLLFQGSDSQVPDSQPLQSDRSLPLQFSIPLTLPADRETHLILGELALYGAAEGQLPPVLATQSFNVTTDLLELLEAIANDFSEPEPEPVAKPAVSPSSTTVPALQFRPSQPSLPPLLRLPDPEKEPRSLQLPTLIDPAMEAEPDVTDRPASEASADSGSEQLVVTEVADPEIVELQDTGSQNAEPQAVEPQAVEPQAVEPQAVEPQAVELQDAESSPQLQPQLELIEEAGDPAIDWQRAEPQISWQRQSPGGLPLPQTPEDSAFRALNLQERFLERLQALASDPDLADWLSTIADPEATENSSSAGEAGLFVRRSHNRAIGLDADLAAQEIVVDEPFFTGDRSPSDQHAGARSGYQSAPEPISSTTVLAPTETISTPQLDVPTGELVSGQTIDITVKIPDTYSRISVKLWTHDRQSRSLLDGPHWLMEFSPDGFGNLVSKTQIMVPFGCLEVQLEAIAIDMTTQFESDKVSVMRSVIPPDLTAVSAVF
ncbi:MAG: hypothetical protein KME15_17520 [Drouetiella hepatica Uher 2000/2452]|jgi:hypothetical protein|uniref:Uncharacterized protein n=1 Tax=Drouetiella hepatica Uher 2000/2452 TaxID=904376 RepID=A0A951QDG2_9CYAN|nr:hypothetical protein [Drouetiella hepatica Uher 2000/2452]